MILFVELLVEKLISMFLCSIMVHLMVAINDDDDQKKHLT